MKKETVPAQSKGCLYLVATPVGNLDDITLRALRVLKEVDLIAAEDTRRSKKLLSFYRIRKPLISFYREREKSRTEKVLSFLKEGRKVALVSDAGMPGISDPGFLLVKRAVENDITVVPVPGSSAFLAALVASGLPCGRFIFEGFLPKKKKERRERLETLVREERTIVFYVSCHNLLEILHALQEYLGGERKIVIARELTKVYEEFWRGKIKEAVEQWGEREIRGEFTLVVGGAEFFSREVIDSVKYGKLYREIEKKRENGGRLSSIVREIAAREGISRRGLYQYYLEKNKEKER